jgi:luciferase family oxidoreductase group 1
MKLSLLDLCPILSGETPSESFKHVVSLAQHAEELGLERFWMAEHHNMEGIGSSSPEVLIAHVASHTKNIRVGSGGIMLPNHATLHIAEVFKTLSALYPHRIDLGLGRAPGSGSKAAHALRGSRGLDANDFPQEVTKLFNWLHDRDKEVGAYPKAESPEVWMLGSSEFGAMMAAERGMPYAFAQHFSHLPALEVMRMYREMFRPSEFLSSPNAIMGVHIICAESDEEARELAMSTELSFSLFIQTGKSISLPTVGEAKKYPYTEEDWKQIRTGSMPKFIGSPTTIKKLMAPIINSKLVDELMVLTMIHDQEKRRQSYSLVKELFS